MKFIPRPYQAYAVEQVIEKPALALMLDMGLGKTAITLTAIKDLMYDYFEVSKVLVIAPKRVAKSTWPTEVKNWDHTKDLKLSIVVGSAKQRMEALRAAADIYVINREMVSWLVNLYKKDWDFDMVVIDESSSFKSPKSERFKDLRKVRPLIKRIVELTGTPSPNGLMDLWSQMYLLDMGERLSKTITAFRRRFYTPGRGNGYVTYKWCLNDGADKEILRRINDICVSMKSKDYLKLPEVIYNKVPVRLSERDRAMYKKMEKDYVLKIANDVLTAGSAGVLTGKLLQLANGCIYNENREIVHLHDEKIQALKELVELNEHTSYLIFYWFNHDLVQLKKNFPYARELKTSEDIEDWNAGKIKMLLVHPASAGHGLNLQFGGYTAIWYSLTWSLELYQQANKRLHRSGQEHAVVIHHLIAEGTIDEDVMRALESKGKSQDSMLEAVKARIKEYAGG